MHPIDVSLRIRTVKREDVTLVFPDGLETPVEVLCVGDGLYRLCEQPFLSESARYGDLIRAMVIDDGRLELREVVEPGHLMMATYLLSSSFIDSDAMKRILDEIMATDGFSQRDLGGCLAVFFDADAYDPRPDIDRMCRTWKEATRDDFPTDP